MPSSESMETKYLSVLVHHKRHGLRQPALICDARRMPVLDEIVSRANWALGRNRRDYGTYFAVRWSGRWQLYQCGDPAKIVHRRLTKAAAEMWLMYRGRSV